MKPHCYFIGTDWNSEVIDQMCIQLGYALAQQGHRVIFLTPRKRRTEDRTSNPAVYNWPSPRPTHLRDAYFLAQLVRQYHPDCFVTDGHAPTSVMLLVGWLLRVPYRVTWYHLLRHGLMLIQETFSPVKRGIRRIFTFRRYMIYRLTKPWFIAYSQAAYRDVQAYLHLPAQRCMLLPLMMFDPAEPLFRDGSIGRLPRKIICAARLSPEKGQDVLLHAIALLRPQFPDLEVEFLGAGPYKDRYIELAQRLDIAGNCRFLGNVPREQVLAHMASSVLSVLPSRSEAFGIVVIEALALGTPVVASSVGGIPDIIRDGMDGFLVPPDNPEALAEAIAKLLLDSDLQTVMSRQARERFLSTHVAEVALPKLRRRLELLVEGDQSPRGASPT